MALRAGRQHRGEDRPVRFDFIIQAELTECLGNGVGVRETKGSHRTQTDGPIITETGKVAEHTVRRSQGSVFNTLGLRRWQRSECRREVGFGGKNPEYRRGGGFCNLEVEIQELSAQLKS